MNTFCENKQTVSDSLSSAAIKYDCHLHSDFSRDSETPAAQMIEQAIRLGVDGLCFTEHEDPGAPYPEGDFIVDFDAYFARMTELREKYRGQIRIGIGVELGIQPHLTDKLDALAAKWPFDFIIASQHIVGRKDPYYPSFFEGRSEQDCYEEYFQVQFETLKKLDPASFDTLGHMDYIVRYGPNKNKYYSYKTYSDYIDPILRLLIENGKCLEINTGGLKYGLGEANPCTDILRRYRELGGEQITIGSDAHEPEYLGYEFVRVAALLKSIGFHHYTIFEQRKGRAIKL